MARPSVLPNGEAFNQRDWVLAKKRAKAMYDHVCVICNKELDANAKAYTNNSVEVDHIYPLSLGGHPYEVSNLQLLCMKCNRRKSNKLPGSDVAIPRDDPLPLSGDW